MWRHLQNTCVIFFVFDKFGRPKGRLLAQTLYERESRAKESRLGHSYNAGSGWGERGKAREALHIPHSSLRVSVRVRADALELVYMRSRVRVSAFCPRPCEK